MLNAKHSELFFFQDLRATMGGVMVTSVTSRKIRPKQDSDLGGAPGDTMLT